VYRSPEKKKQHKSSLHILVNNDEREDAITVEYIQADKVDLTGGLDYPDGLGLG
jgi:hypothetical protein